MRYRASLKSIHIVVAATLALLAVNTANSQLFAGKKEIERQARMEWLMMKRHTPLTPNPRIQRYVECIAGRIINVLDESFMDLSWEVVVFDDEALNAFAMPGGKIGVFTGILNVADTPDSLAAVLGHEVAHLTENHVIERARRGKLTETIGILGGAAGGLGGLAGMGAQFALGLPFSREQESEADLVGLQYMAEAGFDPRASIYLWKNMAAAKEGGTPEWMSTHPSDDRRTTALVRSLSPSLVSYNEARESGQRPNCQY